VSHHLYPFISNNKQLLDSGLAESLIEALSDVITQRDHLLLPSEKKPLSTLDQFPHWLQTLYIALQKMTSQELKYREYRYLNDYLIDTSSARSKQSHPRGLRLCTESTTTAFWVNLVIACDGPATDDTSPESLADRSSKSKNQLPNAMQDLFALSDFYRPMRIGDPNLVFERSLGRSEGYFDRTVVLSNPLLEEVKQALDVLMHWVAVNASDPEFDFFQINLIYSGHASCGKSLGDSNLFLGTEKVSTKTLVESLLASTVRYDVICYRANINVFLDCCYSAAVARDLIVHLQTMQDEAWRASRRPLYACSRLYCSSLDDEESFDEIGLGHSYFVAAYLQENSLEKSSRRWPLLHEIGSRTDFTQNPVLLCLSNDGIEVRFPSLQLLKKELKESWEPEDLERVLEELILLHNLKPSPDGFIDVHQIDLVLAKLKELRKVIAIPKNRAPVSQMRIPSYEERVQYWLF
jgi:hypothetical protein